MGWIHSNLKVGDKLVVYEGMGMKIGSCTFDVIARQGAKRHKQEKARYQEASYHRPAWLWLKRRRKEAELIRVCEEIARGKYK
jgi:hypothetical protein